MNSGNTRPANDGGLDELKDDTTILASAIGGWSGVIDSGAPTAVFLLAFVISHGDLKTCLIAALSVGLVLAVLRVVQGKSLQQVVSGFFGLALSAYLSKRTGHSENFFALGIIQNMIYFAVCLVSIVIRRPVLGYVVQALRGKDNSWRASKDSMRTYSAITWLWVLVFGLRVLITVPLYLTKSIELLGTAKLVLGWPLYAFAVYLTYRVVTKPQVVTSD